MRIAIAGTHRVGKTTLVEAFALAHPEFEVVPEPYEELLDEGAEGFLDELSPESFLAQLARAADRLATEGPAMIFDRSPLDFLAYLRAVDELRLGTSGWDLPVEALGHAAAGLRRLDIVAYIPLGSRHRQRARPGLRSLVDRYLGRLLLSDELGLLAEPDSPQVVLLEGPARSRLVELERTVRTASRVLP